MSEAETDRSSHDASRQARVRSRRRTRARWVDVAVVVTLLMAVAAWFFFIREGESPGPPAPILVAIIEQPLSGAVVVTDWSAPSAVAVDGDRIYVLDTGNNRILAMNRQGVVDRIICETDDCAFLLDGPKDMEYHDGLFYVANTEKGQVNVVDAAGTIIRTYELPAGTAGSPRATGVHVAGDGSVYVSDWTSGKVAIFEPDGAFRRYFGAETVGDFVFLEPTGLALDDEGNLFVAEFSAGRVQKISPIGRHLATFSMVEGGVKVSEASDVLVPDKGPIYMADTERSSVQVFSRGADFDGIIGYFDATRIDSMYVLGQPQGLAVDGDALYVIDSDVGLVVFVVDPLYFVSEQANWEAGE